MFVVNISWLWAITDDVTTRLLDAILRRRGGIIDISGGWHYQAFIECRDLQRWGQDKSAARRSNGGGRIVVWRDRALRVK